MKQTFTSSLCWTVPLIFTVVLVLHVIVGLPQFTYLPETRQFVVEQPEGVIAMGWYGRLVTSALVALILGGILQLALRNRFHRIGPWIAVAGISICSLAVAYHHAAHWIFHH